MSANRLKVKGFVAPPIFFSSVRWGSRSPPKALWKLLTLWEGIVGTVGSSGGIHPMFTEWTFFIKRLA